MIVEQIFLFLTLITIKHFIADFLYQPPYQWMNKGTYGHWGGIVHSGQHAVLTAIILAFFVDSPVDIGLIALLEFVIHYHTDWAKMNLNKKMGWGATTHNEFWILLGVDQLIHSLTYLLIGYIVFM